MRRRSNLLLLRVIGTAAWAGVAALLARIAYGGSPGGILYVIRFEAPATLVVGALALVAAVVAAIAFARGPSSRMAAWSAAAAAAVVPAGVHLRLVGHDSAVAIVAGAVVAFVASLGYRWALRQPA